MMKYLSDKIDQEMKKIARKKIEVIDERIEMLSPEEKKEALEIQKKCSDFLKNKDYEGLKRYAEHIKKVKG